MLNKVLCIYFKIFQLRKKMFKVLKEKKKMKIRHQNSTLKIQKLFKNKGPDTSLILPVLFFFFFSVKSQKDVSTQMMK